MGSVPTGNGGGGSGSATPGTLNISTQYETGSFTIPAGAYRVKLYNMGIDGTGADCTLSTGDSIPVGGSMIYDVVLDQVTNVWKTIPEISGDGNGSRIEIQITK